MLVCDTLGYAWKQDIRLSRLRFLEKKTGIVGKAERRRMALFTKKDLGLLLPDDTPGDPVSLRYTKTKCVRLCCASVALLVGLHAC